MGFWAGTTVDNNYVLSDFCSPAVGAPCGIVDGSPQEEWDANGFRATVELIVPWATRYATAFQFKGGLSGTARVRPMRYTPFPLAVCTSVRMAPGFTIGGISYAGVVVDPVQYLTAGCRMTVTFETVDWEGGHRLLTDKTLNVSESLDGSADFITLPLKEVYWDMAAKNPLKAIEAPARCERLTIWTLNLLNVDTLPVNLFDNAGLVNSDVLTSAKYGRTFAAETLLWLAPTVRDAASAENTRGFNVTLPLSHNAEGWNKFWKPGTAPGTAGVAKQPVYNIDGAVWKPYKTVAFKATLTMLP